MLFGNLDGAVRVQLLVLATVFFIFGIAILFVFVFTSAIKRIMLKPAAS
jgi:hypothetical protein